MPNPKCDLMSKGQSGCDYEESKCRVCDHVCKHPRFEMENDVMECVDCCVEEVDVL